METRKHSSIDKRNQAEVNAGIDSKLKAKDVHRKDIEEILRNAKKRPEVQEVINVAGQYAGAIPKEINDLPSIDDIQNPDLAHLLYWRKLSVLRQRFILRNPEISVPKRAKDNIYKEIRYFLKEGKPIGDSRMAKTRRMADAIKIILDWRNECKLSDVADLYQRFCQANDAFGKKKK